MTSSISPDLSLTDAFWAQRLARNAQVSIFQQWEQLQRSGCIENFRLAAGEGEGFRNGYFSRIQTHIAGWTPRPASSQSNPSSPAAARISRSYPVGVVRSDVSGSVIITGDENEVNAGED